jgi:hypothetical protein
MTNLHAILLPENLGEKRLWRLGGELIQSRLCRQSGRAPLDVVPFRGAPISARGAARLAQSVVGAPLRSSPEATAPFQMEQEDRGHLPEWHAGLSALVAHFSVFMLAAPGRKLLPERPGAFARALGDWVSDHGERGSA